MYKFAKQKDLMEALKEARAKARKEAKQVGRENGMRCVFATGTHIGFMIDGELDERIYYEGDMSSKAIHELIDDRVATYPDTSSAFMETQYDVAPSPYVYHNGDGFDEYITQAAFSDLTIWTRGDIK